MKRLLLILPAVLMLMAGCEDNNRARTTNPYRSTSLLIDTISVHGRTHEILINDGTRLGGIMHSPECWCGKGE